MSLDFPPYFADAEASFSEAKYIIFGVPFGDSSSFRKGSHLAPDSIREASWNFESFDILTGQDLQKIKIHDYGNIELNHSKNYGWLETVKEFQKKIVKQKKFSLAIGGEHAITPPIVSAFSKDICVLSLDAHLDYREEYLGDSNNHACVTRRIADFLPAESLAVVGFRSAESEEFSHAKKDGLNMFSSFEIKKNGISLIIKKIKSIFKDCPLYLTLDIDVVDPAYAPGTSTPEPFGLTPFEVYEIICAFSSQLVGFDVVEVCPPYDHGQTSLLAAKMLRKTIALKENSTFL